MAESQIKWRVVFWGTYDLSKPRVRLLLAGARAVGIEVTECHINVWSGVEDKSQLNGLGTKLRRLFSWFSAYPLLIWRYLLLPAHDAVVIGYMGQLDIIVLWPFARLRGVPVIWDAFISLYDTVVDDRGMVSKRSPIAWLLYAWEWLACRAANMVFLDTKAQARYFEDLFRLPSGSVKRVAVGAETDIFSVSAETRCKDIEKDPFTILFYGQFIPLHGIDTILEAARRVELAGKVARWVVVGQGQEEERIETLIRHLGVKSIERVAWVPYDQLVEWIRRADVCLGIFGTSGKAARVIPNKVYQILAAQRPLITADTPAVRELLEEGPCIRLVPSGDAEALASVVLEMMTAKRRVAGMESGGQFIPIVGPIEVGKQLQDVITNHGAI